MKINQISDNTFRIDHSCISFAPVMKLGIELKTIGAVIEHYPGFSNIKFNNPQSALLFKLKYL